MKFSLLREIVIEHAKYLKQSAEWEGSHSDGGYDSLLSKLNDYKDRLVLKLDLRPSEFTKLNDVEVGEPIEFENVIENYKIKLTKKIKL